MAEYTLKLDLAGDAAVAAKLDKLIGLQGKLATSNPFRSLSVSVNDITKAFDKAAIAHGKFMANFQKSFDKLKAGARTPNEEGLEEWRKRMAQMTPEVIIDKGSRAISDDMRREIERQMQEAMEKYGPASDATPNILPNSPEDIAAEKEKRIRLDADLARMKDAKLKDDMKRGRDEIKSIQEMIRFRANLSMIGGVVAHPGGALTTMFALRQAQMALGSREGQWWMTASGLNKFGREHGLSKATMASIAAFGLTAVATGVGFALKGLSKVIEETSKSIERGGKLYSAALKSGLGLSWTTKRGILASIIGVDEKEVFQFGAQMAYLEPKIRAAANTLAQTAKPLTEVDWNFKILKTDSEALFAKLATEAAPALNQFTDALDTLVKFLNEHTPHLPKWMPNQTTMMFPALTGIAKMAQMFGSLSGGGGMSGMNPFSAGTGGKGMPQPFAWMKQLPASSWEHMGLQIAGGTANYARDTARNTGKMVSLLQRIVTVNFDKSGNVTSIFDPAVNGL